MIEVSAGDYGRMLFEIMARDPSADMPEHWGKIREQAEPLVRKLLALNEKMGVYKIHGYAKKKTKKKAKLLSDAQKIRAAQRQLLVEAGSLQEGDYFWLYENDNLEMSIGDTEPVTVSEVSGRHVYFEWWEGHECIPLAEKVLKAPPLYREYDELCTRFHRGEISPAEFNKQRAAHFAAKQEFTSNAYWLTQYEQQYPES